MRREGIFAGVCAVLMVITASRLSADAPYTFVNFSVPGAARTIPNGLNDAGTIVGTYDDGSGVTAHGFVLTGGSFTTLDYPNPGYAYTVLQGISNNGDIVGFYLTQFSPGGYGTTYSFVYHQGTFTPIPDAPGAMAGTTVARGINGAGQVVGEYVDPCFCTKHAFLYDAGTFTVVDRPGYATNSAQGINDSGQIVGWSAQCWGCGAPVDGFVLNGGTYTTLVVPGQPQSFPSGINNAGDIVGSYVDTAYHAFVLSGGLFTFPADPAAPGSTVVWGPAINALGQITGTFDTGNGLQQGFSATPLAPPDTTAPVIDALSADPSSIWPPDKRMVPVTITATAHDDRTASPACQIIAVSSNEVGPDQWELVGDLSVKVRADRFGSGSGRVYSIIVTCSDDAGNVSSPSVVTLQVPHDHRPVS